MRKEQNVWCEDNTCRHNMNGRCVAANLELEVRQDDHYKPITVCKTYDDSRERKD